MVEKVVPHQYKNSGIRDQNLEVFLHIFYRYESALTAGMDRIRHLYRDL